MVRIRCYQPAAPFSITYLIIVLAYVHISLLNIHADITAAEFCGFFRGRTPDASPHQSRLHEDHIKIFGLLEIPLRLGSPLLVALAKYSALTWLSQIDVKCTCFYELQ